MKRLALVMLCLLALCGCAAPAAVESRVEIPDESYLTGLEPGALGLVFEPSADMPFTLTPSDEALKADGSKLTFEQSFTFNSVPKVRIYPTRLMSYLGCMQAVFVRMKNMGFSNKMDGMYVLNFQLYDSESFKPGTYAKIYEMDVPFEELEKRVFYNDAGFVAVDLTEYMLGNLESKPESPKDNIERRWPNGHPDAEFALKLRDYVMENMSSLLHA